MSKLVLRLGWVMLAILLALPAQAQPKLKFSIASFELDPFDTTAQSEAHKKKDGSGSLYAIIRVKSNNPDDNLREYLFNFGQLKHIIDQEDHGDELKPLCYSGRIGYGIMAGKRMRITPQEGLTAVVVKAR